MGLKELLLDPSADLEARLDAAQSAGDIPEINDELADALLQVVKDGEAPEELRATAAVSLGPVLELCDTDGFEDPDDQVISEPAFKRILETFQGVYRDARVPKDVRRRVLEASVRAPQAWHQNAVRAAWASEDQDWRLTAMFCMQFVKGFESQILEALRDKNPEVCCEAVSAAGNWELQEAWPRIEKLLTSPDTDKGLLLAAIEAAVDIRPSDAGVLLIDLVDSEDPDIAEAAEDAMQEAEMIAEAMEDDPEKPEEDDKLD